MPDGGHLNSFYAPSLSHGIVAFYGRELTPAGAILYGIYTNLGGTVHAVAATNTAAPNGSGTFLDFSQVPSISGNNIAFAGVRRDPGGSRQSGLYLFDGSTLHTIADNNMSDPGGPGKLCGFDQQIVDASGVVAFVGTTISSGTGVYLYSHGHVRDMADKNTAIPGGTGKFQYFICLALADGVLAFAGYNSNGASGIYRYDNTAWQVVADTKTKVPERTGTFTYVSSPSIDQGNVVFYAASGASLPGIYSKLGDQPPVKVIQCGDLLDGKPVQYLNYGGFGSVVSGQSIVIGASFGSAGAIYRIDLSPPVQTTTANFVTKTVLDHTVEDEGATFPQTFTLHNSGTTTWTGLQLVFFGGSAQMCVPPVSVPTTPPGQNAFVTVSLQATITADQGAAQLAYWELKDGDTVVPISGTIYNNQIAANKVWTAITIQPPLDSGSYIPDLNSAGYKDASINPYIRDSRYGGQCTELVWGRVYEKLGIRLPTNDPNASWGDAGKSWIDAAKAAKYNVDTTSTAVPKANCIAVWAIYDANGNEIGGHVAYVESVDGNNVVINEANVKGHGKYADEHDPMNLTTYDAQDNPHYPYWWGAGYDGQPNTSLTISGMRNRGMTLLGYIYLTN